MPGWTAIPPEVNVQSLNTGAGSGTYQAASARWQGISSSIQTIQADVTSTAEGLSGNMDGATKEAANEFLHSMGTWLDHMSVAASKHSKKASEVVTAYESAKAAMVPYPIVMQAKLRSMMPGGGLFGAQALEAKAEYELYRKINGAAMQSYESGTLNAAMPTPVRPFTGKALPGADDKQGFQSPGGASESAAHGSPGGHSGAANSGQGATLGGYNTGGNPAAMSNTGGGYGGGQGSTGGQAGSAGQSAQAGGDPSAAAGSPAGAENGLGGQVGPGAGERPSTVGEQIANAFATPQGPEGVTASGLGQGGEGMPFASQTPADAPYGGLPVGQHTPNGFVPAEGVIASPEVGGAGAPVGGLGGGRPGGLGSFGGSHGTGGAGGSAGRAGGFGGGHAGGAAGSGGAGAGSGSGAGGRIPSMSGMGRGVGGGMMGSGGAGARAGALGAAPIGQGAGRVGAGFSGIPGPENSSKAAGGGSGMRGGMMGGGRRNKGGESGGSNPDIVVEKREVHDPVLERERARVNAERFF